MRFSKIILIGSVLLSVTACGSQEKTPLNNNKAQVISAPIKLHDIVEFQSQQDKPALNLSVDSIKDESEKNYDGLFINNNVIDEENSALFITLNKKHPESKISLSSELLTDKNAGDNTNFIKSIDGIQIDVKGSFK